MATWAHLEVTRPLELTDFPLERLFCAGGTGKKTGSSEVYEIREPLRAHHLQASPAGACPGLNERIDIDLPAINRGKNRKRSAFMVGFGGKVRKFMDTPADGTLTAYNKVHEVASRVSEELEALTLAECR
eukprot:4006434-Pleurochrysis_carterae.AAC.2